MAQKTVELEMVAEDGETIVREGEPGSDMFIIQEGEVTVIRTINGREVVVATLGRGSFFGEMSLLESLPRIATVRAAGKTRLLVLKRGGLLLKIRRDPTFALEMLQNMSSRLRYISQQLSALLASEEVSGEKLSSLVASAEIESLKETET